MILTVLFVLLQADGDDSSSSSDEGGDAMDAEMGDAEMHPPHAVPLEPPIPQAPVVDADGFQVVQTKRRGRR